MSHFRVRIRDLPTQGHRFRLGVRNIELFGQMSALDVVSFAEILFAFAAAPRDTVLARPWCVTVIDALKSRIDRGARIRLATLLARAIDSGEARFVFVGLDESTSHWIARSLRCLGTSERHDPIFR